MDTTLYVILGLVAAYVVFVVWLVQSKRLEKWNLSLLLGIILMIRTNRGKPTIDWLAKPRRLWNAIGDIGIVLSLAIMLLMTLFFLYLATLVFQEDSPVPALGPAEILVIPGVTPFVPLGYGVLALVVTLVVHEAGHGILARANGMKLKSVGLLYAVIPIGAFVEPDDLDMKVASRRQRLRVFAAGPTINFAIAALALTGFALMMGSLAESSGAHIATVVKDGPADVGGLRPGDTIVAARHEGGAFEPMRDENALVDVFLANSRPGENVAFTLQDGRIVDAELSSKWDALPQETREEINAETPVAMEFCRQVLARNVTGASDCYDGLRNAARLGFTPFVDRAFEPLKDPLGRNGLNLAAMFALPASEILGGASFLGVYVPSFYATPFDHTTFWVLANILFWVFWINAAVGLTNVLPMLPLDGGHIFRDAVGGVFQRLRPGLDPEKREAMVTRTATLMSLLIFGAFLIQIFGPHLRDALAA